MTMTMTKRIKVSQLPEFDASEYLNTDELIELAEKLQLRRILDEIKKVAAICPSVAAIYPSSEFGSPAVEAAWQLCCEEIFYRATGERWHMNQDSNH